MGPRTHWSTKFILLGLHLWWKYSLSHLLSLSRNKGSSHSPSRIDKTKSSDHHQSRTLQVYHNPRFHKVWSMASWTLKHHLINWREDLIDIPTHNDMNLNKIESHHQSRRIPLLHLLNHFHIWCGMEDLFQMNLVYQSLDESPNLLYIGMSLSNSLGYRHILHLR